MEYFVDKEPRSITVKYQIGLPRDILDAIKARNSLEHARDLYLTVASVPTRKGPISFVKCFDYFALENIAKHCIDASKIRKVKIDRSGRVCITKDIAEGAEMETLDRIVIVKADSGSNWGMTFGIYEMNNYHQIEADEMETRWRKELELPEN